MGLENYYEKFHVQGRFKVELPGVPPPWNIVDDFGDVREVMGLFILKQSEERFATGTLDVFTRGQFITHPVSNLHHGNTLRRDSDSTYIRLEGEPTVAPTQAISQVKSFVATVTSRGDEERRARLSEGAGVVW